MSECENQLRTVMLKNRRLRRPERIAAIRLYHWFQWSQLCSFEDPDSDWLNLPWDDLSGGSWGSMVSKPLPPWILQVGWSGHHGTPKWAHTSNLPYVFLWFFSCFPWFLAEFPYEPWLNYGKFFVLGDGASANTRTLARARRARLVASPSSSPSICTAPASKWSLPSNRTSSVTGTARALGAWRIDHNPESYTHLSIHIFNVQYLNL